MMILFTDFIKYYLYSLSWMKLLLNWENYLEIISNIVVVLTLLMSFGNSNDTNALHSSTIACLYISAYHWCLLYFSCMAWIMFISSPLMFLLSCLHILLSRNALDKNTKFGFYVIFKTKLGRSVTVPYTYNSSTLETEIIRSMKISGKPGLQSEVETSLGYEWTSLSKELKQWLVKWLSR